MKKRNIHYLLFFLVFMACGKDGPVRLHDPRKKYEGAWQFTNMSQFFYITNKPVEKTENVVGIITADASDKTKKRVLISIGSWDAISAEVDNKGNLTGCGLNGNFSDRHNLSFSWNSSHCTSALGPAYTIANVTGTK